ncbi:hypothetical protein ACTHOQ_18470 [Solibacillus silvestris]
MKIDRKFDNVAPVTAIRVTLEVLFDTFIAQYYSEDKVISTASSFVKEDA